MKKIPAVFLALIMLFTTACGVQQTPVTGTATPTPETETPEARDMQTVLARLLPIGTAHGLSFLNSFIIYPNATLIIRHLLLILCMSSHDSNFFCARAAAIPSMNSQFNVMISFALR